MLKKLGLIALCGASAFAMHTIELNVNDKDLEFGARLDMGQFSDATEPDTVFVGGKFLHGDDSHSDFDNSSDIHDYMELNFLMKREIDDIGLSIGLGVKLNNTENFTTVPLGVEASYKLPVDVKVPMYINAVLYYAPEVLSMGDAKSFLEYRLEFDAEVIKNGHVIAGYRNMDTNYDSDEGGNINYNSSPYVGFRFAF
ncbi:MAG: hypothetical protein J7L21_05675 [Sulfurimonas sp.]|nr:hypothetical protein [Sulfurimonas sp.]